MNVHAQQTFAKKISIDRVQRLLNIPPTGTWDLASAYALSAWQRQHGFPAHGELTPEVSAILSLSWERQQTQQRQGDTRANIKKKMDQLSDVLHKQNIEVLALRDTRACLEEASRPCRHTSKNCSTPRSR